MHSSTTHKPLNLLEKIRSLALLMLIIFGLNIYAQKQTTEIRIDQLKDYSNKIYQTDDILVEGTKYLPSHYNAKGHPYFLSDLWKSGTIDIHGKKYENSTFLYNIEIDRVILNTTIKDSLNVYLTLSNDVVDGFTIEGHSFVNFKKLSSKDEIMGFVELIYSGNLSFISKHKKTFLSNYTPNTPNGSYSKLNTSYYVLNQDILTKLNHKKSFLKYFAAYKKQVKQFMRKNKIRYKTADNAQFNQLFEYCDGLNLHHEN